VIRRSSARTDGGGRRSVVLRCRASQVSASEYSEANRKNANNEAGNRMRTSLAGIFRQRKRDSQTDAGRGDEDNQKSQNRGELLHMRPLPNSRMAAKLMCLCQDEDGNGGDDTADGLPKPATRWMPQVESFASRIVMFALPGGDEEPGGDAEKVEGIANTNDTNHHEWDLGAYKFNRREHGLRMKPQRRGETQRSAKESQGIVMTRNGFGRSCVESIFKG
jgi:hypothetical protein